MHVCGGVFLRNLLLEKNQDLKERYSLANILVKELLGIE